MQQGAFDRGGTFLYCPWRLPAPLISNEGSLPMPIFKADHKLIYYAHVPKCGGSAVAWYLRQRFGQIAFSDSQQTRHATASTWSKTSPQHIDTESLSRLFPDGFFDATFTIVRHPVPRLVSAFHFQRDVEKSISAQILFSDWLEDINELRRENPFLYDNHVRPMVEIVPEGAQVFYMEHGLDELIIWFDQITGDKGGPRAIPKLNEKDAHASTKTERVRPTQADIERIAELYPADFTRFGYDVSDTTRTTASTPQLSDEFRAERDAALRAFGSPLNRLKRKISRKLKV